MNCIPRERSRTNYTLVLQYKQYDVKLSVPRIKTLVIFSEHIRCKLERGRKLDQNRSSKHNNK